MHKSNQDKAMKAGGPSDKKNVKTNQAASPSSPKSAQERLDQKSIKKLSPKNRTKKEERKPL